MQFDWRFKLIVDFFFVFKPCSVNQDVLEKPVQLELAFKTIVDYFFVFKLLF